MIRENIILKEIKGKDILDIGSTGQTTAYNLWNLMEKQAKKITGIDIMPSKDKRVIQGNMEDYNFKKRFDVIVAGDIIEHVDNPGLLLKNIHKHLKDNGKFILTTPNARWPTVLLPPNKTHTHWHDRYTIKRLLENNGFKIKRFMFYYGNKKHYNFIKKILAFRKSMLIIAKRS